MPIMTIVRGLPGSGKTTYVKNNFECQHVDADHLRIIDGKYVYNREDDSKIFNMCKSLTTSVLAFGSDVVVSGVFLRSPLLWEFIRLGNSFSYDVTVLRCMGEFGNTHNVPADILDKMRLAFEDFDMETVVSVKM